MFMTSANNMHIFDIFYILWMVLCFNYCENLGLFYIVAKILGTFKLLN